MTKEKMVDLVESSNKEDWYKFAELVITVNKQSYINHLISQGKTPEEAELFSTDYNLCLEAFHLEFIDNNMNEVQLMKDNEFGSSTTSLYEDYRKHFRFWFGEENIDGLSLNDFLNINTFEDYQQYFEERKNKFKEEREKTIENGIGRNEVVKKHVETKVSALAARIESADEILDMYRSLFVYNDKEKTIRKWMESEPFERRAFVENMNIMKSLLHPKTSFLDI